MPEEKLNKEMNLVVTARFIGKGDDRPLSNDHTVRLYDKDVFGDDYLGESSLDDNGVARISFSHEAFEDPLNLDTKPDFYFIVLKEGQQLFSSKVMEDIDIDTVKNFRMGVGEVIDLGTFLV